ncbi:MAG TPA: VWA-like domain-containing protein [Dongiaceae bacterium]|nr:VWA-like domain-containing protein [Dongiaceae bacterium]
MLERIVKQRTALVLSQPFFGVLSLRLKLLEDPTCETAWVDGDSLGYNPDFIATLDDLELRGLLAHEVLHVANGHCWRKGARDHDRWNDACDYAINPLVLSASLKLPSGGLLDGRFLGKSAEAIYATLRQERGQGAPSQGGSPGADQSAAGGSGEGGPPPAQPTTSLSASESPTPATSTPTQPNRCGEVRQYRGSDKPTKESDWKIAVNLAAKAARMRGTMTGGMEQMVEAATRPSVDWRAVLRRFACETAQADYSWSMPNRRYLSLGLYLPSLHSTAVGDAVYVRDSSGSVFDETQRQFAAEIIDAHHQINPARLIVIDCDTRVTQVQIFERGEAIDLAPLKGGGGTSFKAPFEWLEREGVQPAFLVYLTDMEGSFPSVAPTYPTLWASVTPSHRMRPAPFGEVVEVVV